MSTMIFVNSKHKTNMISAILRISFITAHIVNTIYMCIQLQYFPQCAKLISPSTKTHQFMEPNWPRHSNRSFRSTSFWSKSPLDKFSARYSVQMSVKIKLNLRAAQVAAAAAWSSRRRQCAACWWSCCYCGCTCCDRGCTACYCCMLTHGGGCMYTHGWMARCCQLDAGQSANIAVYNASDSYHVSWDC